MTIAKDTIIFNFAITVDNGAKRIYRTIMANSSCEAYTKCIANVSETEVNVIDIRLVSRSDR